MNEIEELKFAIRELIAATDDAESAEGARSQEIQSGIHHGKALDWFRKAKVRALKARHNAIRLSN